MVVIMIFRELQQESMDYDGHDTTSGLPNDIIMAMVTLGMGHRQTVTSRLLMMSQAKPSHPDY